MTTRKTTPNVLDDLMSATPAGAAVSRETDIVRVPLELVLDNPYQYRQHYDPASLKELAISIKSLQYQLQATTGLQSPPLARMVVVDDDGAVISLVHKPGVALLADPNVRVQLLLGHRRLRAFRLLAAGDAGFVADADFTTLPVFLVDASDGDMWRHALTENSQRDDVSAIEEAQLLKRAIDDFGLSLEEAGQAWGWSRSAVSNKLRLLDLPEGYRQAILQGTISETHGRTLLTLKTAPHLLLPVDKIADMNRIQLEGTVKAIIANCVPLAPAPQTGYARPEWSGSPRTIISKCDPPKWPYDWMPDADVCDPAIVGPCDTCSYRVQFAGDAGPRCTQPPLRASCYAAKDRQWQDIQIARQQAAAAELMQQRQVTPKAVDPTPAGEGKPLVELTDQDWEAKKQQATTARPAEVLQARVATDGQVADVTFFGKPSYSTAPAELIDKGLCGPDRCECFVLAYNMFADKDNVQPDAEGAPNMCYGCASKARMIRRKQELEHGDVTAKRKHIKATNDACVNQLRMALLEFDAQGLWDNREFLSDMVKAGAVSRAYSTAALTDARAIQEHIWMHVAASNCKRYSSMGVDGENFHWNPELVDAWLRRLRAGAGLPDPDVATESGEAANLEEVIQRLQAAAAEDQPSQPAAEDPVSQETATADVAAATATDLPADLVAHGWHLQPAKGGQVVAVVDVDGEAMKTRPGTVAEVIGHAVFMDKQLQIGVQA